MADRVVHSISCLHALRSHQDEVVLGSGQGHIQALRISHKVAWSGHCSGQNDDWLLQALLPDRRSAPIALPHTEQSPERLKEDRVATATSRHATYRTVKLGKAGNCRNHGAGDLSYDNPYGKGEALNPYRCGPDQSLPGRSLQWPQ